MKTYELFEMSKEQLCNYIKELKQENQKLRKILQNIKEQATILTIPTTAEKEVVNDGKRRIHNS